MKIFLAAIFTIVSLALTYLGVSSVLQFNSNLSTNYAYSEAEKGQIITIEASKFNFTKDSSSNTYQISVANKDKISLDSSKYGLSEFFKTWQAVGEEGNSVTLQPPSNCTYINFVLHTKKNSSFADSLEYIYCSRNIRPNFESL